MQTKHQNTNGNIVTLTVIEIARVTTSAAGFASAIKLRDAIAGPDKSLMDFRVETSAYRGELVVNVETNYPASEKKIREFLTYLMFIALTK